MEDITKNQAYTFENVWAALLETRANNEEAHRRMDEALTRLEKTVANTSKIVGGLGNLQGRLTEAMFEAELCKKFYDIGFSFDKQSSRYKFRENGQTLAEADFFLENGEYAMPVEIKTELSVSDIDEHIERIAIIRGCMDVRGDKRKLAGAIAGEIVAENVLNYAHKKGLYVLTQNGDCVAIADAPHNFKRQEW